jgi:uncharacterized protein YozE (UPF0346 family)
MTFKAWLMLQTKRDDSVGDLASDVHDNRTWPLTQGTVKLRQYMRKRGAIENALTALDRAYSEYQKEDNRLRSERQ